MMPCETEAYAAQIARLLHRCDVLHEQARRRGMIELATILNEAADALWFALDSFHIMEAGSSVNPPLGRDATVD